MAILCHSFLLTKQVSYIVLHLSSPLNSIRPFDLHIFPSLQRLLLSRSLFWLCHEYIYTHIYSFKEKQKDTERGGQKKKMKRIENKWLGSGGGRGERERKKEGHKWRLANSVSDIIGKMLSSPSQLIRHFQTNMTTVSWSIACAVIFLSFDTLPSTYTIYRTRLMPRYCLSGYVFTGLGKLDSIEIIVDSSPLLFKWLDPQVNNNIMENILCETVMQSFVHWNSPTTMKISSCTRTRVTATPPQFTYIYIYLYATTPVRKWL